MGAPHIHHPITQSGRPQSLGSELPAIPSTINHPDKGVSSPLTRARRPGSQRAGPQLPGRRPFPSCPHEPDVSQRVQCVPGLPGFFLGPFIPTLSLSRWQPRAVCLPGKSMPIIPFVPQDTTPGVRPTVTPFYGSGNRRCQDPHQVVVQEGWAWAQPGPEKQLLG